MDNNQLNSTAKFAQQQQLQNTSLQQYQQEHKSSIKKSKSQSQLQNKKDVRQQSPEQLQRQVQIENEKDLFSRLQEDQSQQSMLSEQLKNLSPIRSNLFSYQKQQQRQNANNKSLSPNRDIPQPSPQFERVTTQPQQKQHKDECCRQYMNLSRTLHEEQKSKSPVRKTQSHYEKLLDEMGQKLYQAEEQLRVLNIVNQKYKDKLLEFHSQNQQNVQIAQQEFQKINQEKKENEDLKNLLESEVKTLRQQLNDIIVKNYNLEKVQEKYMSLEQKAEQYAQALDKYTQNEMKTDIAEQFNLKRQYKLLFTHLQYSTKTSKLIDSFRQFKDKQQIYNIVIQLIDRWHSLTQKNKLVNKIEAHKKYDCVKCFFKQWKQNIVFQKNIRVVIAHKHEKIQFDRFCDWRQFVASSKRKKNKNQLIRQFRNKKMLQKGFRSFLILFKKMKHSFVEAKEATKKLEKYTKLKYRSKGFRAWMFWYLNIRLPIKQIEKVCLNNYKKSLLRNGFNFLQNNRQQNLILREKVEKQIKKKQFRLMRKLFKFWKEDYPNFVKAQIIQDKKIQYLYKKRAMDQWKNSIKRLAQDKQIMQSAKQVHEQRVMKKCFDLFFKNRLKHKQTVLFGQAIVTKKLSNQVKLVFGQWFKQSLIQRSERLKQQSENLQVEQQYFKNWQNFYRQAKLKRYRNNAVASFIQRKAKALQNEIVQGWRYYTVRKNRNKRVVEQQSIKKSYQMFRVFIMELQKQQKLNLKGIISKLSNKSSLIEADYKNNLEQLQSIDDEKLELKQTIIDLQAQFQAEHDQLLQEKANNGQVKKQIMENEKSIQKLEEEKIALQQRIINLQSEQEEEGINYKTELNELNKKHGSLSIENGDLSNEIIKLHKELDFTKQVLRETEQSMLQKGQQTNNLLNDTDQKLQTSILMANEFKNRILVQDQELEQLKQQLEASKVQQNEQGKKIVELTYLIKEQQDMYEQKLIKQQNLIESNQVSLVELNGQNEKMSQVIADQNVALKKYMFEVEMLQENKHQTNEEFIKKVKVDQDDLAQLNQGQKIYQEAKQNYEQFIDGDKNFMSQKKAIGQKLMLLQENLSNILNNQSSAKRKSSPYRKQFIENDADMPRQIKSVQGFDQYKSPDNLSQNKDFINNSFMDENHKVKQFQGIIRSEIQSPIINHRENRKKGKYSINLQSDVQTSVIQDNNSDKLNCTCPGEQITEELEKNKRQRNQVRENLQQRIKKLTENLDSDLFKPKNYQQ
eukprot:TRINITY_DN4018_c0_g1_i1.p1 TRINITY_DN4018_c0_g1~~TRINITY_DN4018_c0_g1_i1.p1  ORF type:complete len:1241 (-),score=224.08 TRINITY_DN4018_c0_g1_i1:234-3956(-)